MITIDQKAVSFVLQDVSGTVFISQLADCLCWCCYFDAVKLAIKSSANLIQLALINTIKELEAKFILFQIAAVR